MCEAIYRYKQSLIYSPKIMNDMRETKCFAKIPELCRRHLHQSLEKMLSNISLQEQQYKLSPKTKHLIKYLLNTLKLKG
jgi:hypothetical protein